ncbi:alpha-L-fucosidase [Adelges cooleyi]|uniref:alpha-L-fucosidase n=1 Tax=Adelges cooleyi TaxID=133065 RepID=UPI00217FC267|nr:alpha-L-fucosidase [Adelges cooleyi]
MIMSKYPFFVCYLIAACVLLPNTHVIAIAADEHDVQTNDDPEQKPAVANNRYEPTWDSLDARPLPTWYDKAKFGVFIHWGVYSVPGFGSEWFWMNWRGRKGHSYVNFMTKNFKPGFSYQDFGPKFTTEFFDPMHWADLIRLSGAKYVVLTSKHHEGYTMWPSKRSFGWNSMDVGPHRDIVGELSRAIRSLNTTRFGLYHSLYEWFNPLWIEDKFKNLTTRNFVTDKVLPELHELVHEYKPEIIWSDGEWEAPDTYWDSLNFLAWLYNDSPVKDTVVVNDRWGGATLCKHGGFLTCADRYQPGKLVSRKWENAMTVDKFSWGYRRNARSREIFSTQELINQLVETVSFGGNLLLNVGPTSDGMIPPIFEERLLQIGQWLSINGASIFDTTPWPKCQNDTVDSNLWYTQGNSTTIYSIITEWPENGLLNSGCLDKLDITSITMLETRNHLKWSPRAENGIVIKLDDRSKVKNHYAWVLQVVLRH